MNVALVPSRALGMGIKEFLELQDHLPFKMCHHKFHLLWFSQKSCGKLEKAETNTSNSQTMETKAKICFTEKGQHGDCNFSKVVPGSVLFKQHYFDSWKLGKLYGGCEGLGISLAPLTLDFSLGSYIFLAFLWWSGEVNKTWQKIWWEAATILNQGQHTKIQEMLPRIYVGTP